MPCHAGPSQAAPGIYRIIRGYRLTHRRRRLRFGDAPHGQHNRSSHRHLRDLVHGRRDGSRQHVVAAFGGCALAPALAPYGFAAEFVVLNNNRELVA